MLPITVSRSNCLSSLSCAHFFTLHAVFSWLDLSFNQIRKIENIATLTELRELYFVNCKIAELEGLDSLVNLRLLEMGSNRLRTIQNLGNLTNLEELWLGRNKIATIQVRFHWVGAVSLSHLALTCASPYFTVCLDAFRELIKRPPGSRHSSQASKVQSSKQPSGLDWRWPSPLCSIARTILVAQWHYPH